MSPRERAAKESRVRLKPADPFDLIRLLARSQSDPRKAVCELVQNSLDAGARRIEIQWLNDKGARVLRIHDDGHGVFPELGREDALRRIATTIGHSHKRNLSPQERREMLALGKYGIGLLGFWAVGKYMEIRSRVADSETLVLRLTENQESATITKLRGRRIDEAPTYTEVVISSVHEVAARQIKPGRLQAYLSGELRGQLLGRDDVEIHIHDRVARGNALKHFVVRPQRFVGRHLSEFIVHPVPGHEDVRIELYLVSADDDRSGTVQLACGGTTVLDDIAQLTPDEGPRAPWDVGRLEGVIDFPELEVAPSTRRGFVPNGAANAFLEALPGLELQLMAIVREDESLRIAQKSKSMAREIRKAFRRVALLPEYELFDVRVRGSSLASGAATAPETSANDVRGQHGAQLAATESSAANAPLATDPSSNSELDSAASEPKPRVDREPSLFPPGPLARIRISPPKLRVAPGAQRKLRALAFDADGREPVGAIEWTWKAEGPGEIVFATDEAHFTAAPEPCTARVLVRAQSGAQFAEASVPVDVLAELAGEEKVGGIPEPAAVYAPSDSWRSRMRGEQWEFNSGHKDYLDLESNEARRVRYLVHLFAKEVVQKNFGQPGDAHVLERMVQVLTHLDPGRGA